MSKGAHIGAENLMSMTEKEWQQLILDFARLRQWLPYHTFDSRKSAAGFPDLVLVRGDRLIFSELKTERGKVSDAQQEWIDALNQVPRAEVYVWRPSHWDSVQDVLR